VSPGKRVRNNEEDWHDPTKEDDAPDLPSFHSPRVDQEQLQISSFAQHPGIGGEHEIVLDYVENSAPDLKVGKERVIIESILSHNYTGLASQTWGRKRTHVYQTIQQKLLSARARKRFLCIVIRPQWRFLGMESNAAKVAFSQERRWSLLEAEENDQGDDESE
jgi:hypothetical protein